jgi:hypothetical protein
VSAALKPEAHVRKVVNFPVQHHANGPVLVRDRLLPRGQIDHGEPTGAERDMIVDVCPLVVRPPVSQRCRHPAQELTTILPRPTHHEPGDSTHVPCPQPSRPTRTLKPPPGCPNIPPVSTGVSRSLPRRHLERNRSRVEIARDHWPLRRGECLGERGSSSVGSAGVRGGGEAGIFKEAGHPDDAARVPSPCGIVRHATESSPTPVADRVRDGHQRPHTLLSTGRRQGHVRSEPGGCSGSIQ